MAHASALDANSLSSFIARSLPKDANPQLRSPTDAIAISCHAGMLSVGFRLVGLDEDHRIGIDCAALSSSRIAYIVIEMDGDSHDVMTLPMEWNVTSVLAFRYKHQQSSMEYLLKVSRLGSKTMINGIAIGDDKPADFHLVTADFVSISAFPASPISSPSASFNDSKGAIISIFNSPARLTELGTLLRISIIQPLMPSLRKEGYEETRSTISSSGQNNSQQGRSPGAIPEQPRYSPPVRSDLPGIPHPARRPLPSGEDLPPGFEDEHQVLQPPRNVNPHGGQRFPSYGERDLYPQGLGPHDPLRIGGVGPGMQGGGGGGMHPTFHDPIFGEYDEGSRYDLQVPPGARFDPVGPGMRLPSSTGNRFGSRGPPSNPFSGFGREDFI